MDYTSAVVILVTGSDGMVGSNLKQLVSALQQEDASKSLSEAEFAMAESGGSNSSIKDFLVSVMKATSASFVFTTRKDADLCSLEQTRALFDRFRPTHVLHLAARVGGLFANMGAKVQFWQDNMAINDNVIRTAHDFKVRRLVCCLSTCIYPDKVPAYPIQEDWLHLGPPHPSNEGYAFAKRMCEVQCRLYREQFGCDFVCVVPTNLYGPFDNYSESTSHVVAALIRRAH